MLDNDRLKTLIDELKAQHGTVVHLTARGEEVIIRAPRRAEYKRFRELAFDEKRKATAAETLLRDVLVYPSVEELNAMLERFPAASEVFGAEAVKLAGGQEEIEAKKF